MYVAEPQSISPIELSALCKQVSFNVNRAALWHSLVATKLIDNATTREELRRKCPDSTSWTKLICERLQDPLSRSAALRALAEVADEFANLPTFRPFLRTSIRKVRAAASREDLPRLKREIERLNNFKLELPDIPDIHAFLFVCLRADAERAALDKALKSLAAETAITASQSGAIAVRDSNSELPALKRDRQVLATMQATNELIAELERAIVLNLEPAPEGILDDFKSACSSVSEFTVPDVVLEECLQLLTASARRFALRAPQTASQTGQDLSLVSTWLMGTEELVAGANGIKKLLSEFSTSVIAAFSAYLPNVDKTMLIRAHAITLALASGSTFYTALDEIAPFLSENKRCVTTRNTTLIDLGTRLIQATVAISDGNSIWRDVRNLLATDNLAALEAMEAQLQERLLTQNARVDIQNRILISINSHLSSFESIPKDEAGSLLKLLLSADETDVETVITNLLSEYAVTATNLDAETAEKHSSSPTLTVIEGGINLKAVSTPLTPPAGFHGRSWPASPANFAPRNPFCRMLESQNASQWPILLLDFGLQSLRRGSSVGVIDSALDMLLLASGEQDDSVNKDAVGAAFALLCSLPNNSSDIELAEVADNMEVGLGDNPIEEFRLQLKYLLRRPMVEETVSQIFGFVEAAPFATFIGAQLHSASMSESIYLLEDVARGLGRSAGIADPAAGRELLFAISKCEAIDDEALAEARRITSEGIGIGSRKIVSSVRNSLPYWLHEGIDALRKSLEQRGPISRSPAKASGFLNCQVPPIVQSRGYPYNSQSRSIDLVLLISNPDPRRIATAAELVIPVSRNVWLVNDLIFSIGPLRPGETVLARVHATTTPVVADGSLNLGYQLRIKESGVRETRFQDGKLTIRLTAQTSITIEPYAGANGLPILLTPEKLRLSSPSVGIALNQILEGVTHDGIAAIVVGRRRRGKTSILSTIREDSRVTKRYIVQLDTMQPRPFRSAGEALVRLGSILDSAIQRSGNEMPSLRDALLKQSEWQVFELWIDDVTRRLSKKVELLLLLDEFQNWLSPLDTDARAQVLWVLRGLYNRQSAMLRISIVLAGLTNIEQYTSCSTDFSAAFRVLKLKELGEEESARLIRSNSTIEFDLRAVRLITELSGGNPYLINLLGSAIAEYLRYQEPVSPYCFRTNVESVVDLQRDENSPIWKYVRYLFSDGEEDDAPVIQEMPALRNLAYTLRLRGTMSRKVTAEEIELESRKANVTCDPQVLRGYLDGACVNELLRKESGRYRFSSPWLAEWLAMRPEEDAKPVRIDGRSDPDIVLRRYKILRTLSMSGQAQVYCAQDTQNIQGMVVLKIYRPSKNGFIVKREAESLSRISDAAVVQCINYAHDDTWGDVVILKYVSGQPLRELMDTRPLNAQHLLGSSGILSNQIAFLTYLAKALSKCHAVGIIHKDLKPENIIVQPEQAWLPVIIDFGVAEPVQAAVPYPTANPYTERYASPEKLRGVPRDSTYDVYALGLISYELLAGMHPFEDADREARIEGQFVPLHVNRPDVPVALSNLLARVLSVNPAERPTAAALAEELPNAAKALDWRTFYYKAIDGESSEQTFESAKSGVFSAPLSDWCENEFKDLVESMLKAGHECSRIWEVCLECVECVLATVFSNKVDVQPLLSLCSGILDDPVNTEEARTKKLAALQSIVRELYDNREPSAWLTPAVNILLDRYENPLLRSMTDDLYLLANVFESYLGKERSIAWCVTTAKKARIDSRLTDAQLWLERAEVLGAKASSDYVFERGEMARLRKGRADQSWLPEAASNRSISAIGESERGHLDVDKINRWVFRFARLFPFVSDVHRLSKDNDCTGPTRILSLEVPARHRSAGGASIDIRRTVAAVLDETVCGKIGCGLRINIMLSESTSAAQRIAAIEHMNKHFFER